MKNLLLFLILLLSAQAAQAQCPTGNILYVNDDAGGSNDGTSWANAFTDLQDALNSTCPGITQIWVAQGTYTPGTARTDAFVMKNDLAILGGFPNIGNPGIGDRNTDPLSNGTVLSGEIGLAGSGDNSVHVIFNDNNGLNNTAVLDGFIITGGNADIGSTRGGGMFNTNSSPTVTNCSFSGNSASPLYGGGMFNGQDASPTVTNCSFSGNSAGAGGGMCNDVASPTITNCSFSGNNSAGTGGGMFNLFGSFPTLTNCSFSGNSASSGVGGIRNDLSSPILTNCILWGNGTEIQNSDNSNPIITYSIVQQPSGVYPGTGNLNVDPLFVSQPPIGLGTSGDLRLQGCSQAIDVGDDSANSTSEDLDGNDRTLDAIPGNAVIDLGAYEFQGTVPIPVASCRDITVSLTGNSVTINPEQVDGGSLVECSFDGLFFSNVSPNTFDCTDVGPQLVTLTITASNGFSDDCAATITVVDNTPLTVTCPAPAAAECGAATDPLNTGTATGSDNCGTAIITRSDSFAAACGNTGVITRTWTATDASGNSSSCDQIITIVDTRPPTIVIPPDETVECGEATDSAVLGTAIGTDGCGTVTVAFSDSNVPGCGNTETITRTWTVTDACGNQVSGPQIITVQDMTDPDLSNCASRDATAECGQEDLGAWHAANLSALAACATDACDNDLTISSNFVNAPFVVDCGTTGTTTVTYTVTDDCANATDFVATYTVEDNIAPTALCQNVTVQLDANGSGSTSAAAVDNGSSDACGIGGLSVSPGTFGCGNTGGNTVTLTVTDVNTNTASCTATVTVEDNIAPTAACLNTTVEIQPDGFYELQQSDVYDAANSSDNCSIASVSFPATTFGCDDLDLTFPVMVTVTDPSGNTDDCTANVSVVAGTALPPEWSANDIGNQGSGSDYAYDPCAGNNPSNGDFTISTGGYNLIPQNSDNLAFASVSLCGNGGIQARIKDVVGGYAGLMIRESSAPGAKMFAVYSNQTNLLRREIRTVENGQRSSNTFFASFPQWLRLVRQGDLIRAFYRNSNGGNWTLFHQAYLPMGNCVEMGLAVFTTDPSGDASAVFSKVNYQSQGGQSLSTPNTLAWEAETPDVQSASVLPNPVRGNFTLQFSKPLAAAGQAVLLNQAGQALRQRQLQPGVLTTDWNASDLPAGLYFMEIATEDGYREVLKVVRQ